MFGVKFNANLSKTSSDGRQAEDLVNNEEDNMEERRLFVILSAIEHLHNVDFSPIIVHILKMLITKCPDYACFAIMDIVLKPQCRDMYLGPLVTSPVRAAALHEEYEHILHQILPITTSEIIKSAEQTSELLLSKEQKSDDMNNLPVLGSLATCIFPGLLEGLVNIEVRWGILRDYFIHGWKVLMKYGVGIIKLIKRKIKNKQIRESTLSKMHLEEKNKRTSSNNNNNNTTTTSLSSHDIALNLVREYSQSITLNQLRKAANSTRTYKMKYVGIPSNQIIEKNIDIRKEEYLNSNNNNNKEVEEENNRLNKIKLEKRILVMSQCSQPLNLVLFENLNNLNNEDGFGIFSPSPPLLFHSLTRNMLNEKKQLLIEKDKDKLLKLQSKSHPILLLAPEPLNDIESVKIRCFLSKSLPKPLRHLKLKLVFSTDIDGYNLNTLIECVKGSHWVLVVNTSKNMKFGVCGVDTPIKLGTSAGSSPDMFFFTLPSSSSNNNVLQQPGHIAYKKKDINLEGMLCITKQFFGVAPALNGDGFGLFLSEDLQHGSSVKGNGFDNHPLHLPIDVTLNNADARNFDISDVEMYELVF